MTILGVQSIMRLWLPAQLFNLAGLALERMRIVLR